MAFYRCGGGSGIPSQVTTDMNNVLNKKFSTSGQTYPPLEWADDVNLLGLLEEKTASGAIANITDGADGVPLKNWLVTLPASLSGYSEVNGTKQKKNFYPIQIGADRFSNNGGATHSNNNGTLVITATTNNNCGVYINTNDALCELRNVLKWFYDNSYPRSISLDVKCSVDNATLAITSGTRYTFTMGTTKTRVSLVSTGANCSMYVQGADLGQSCTFEISNFQIEYGSTATAYEAYTAPTQYTASLGRTIYGGTADIVTGEGEDDFGKVTDFSALTANGTSSTGAYRYRLNITNCGGGTYGDAVSNVLTYRRAFNANANEFYNNDGYLLIYLSQDNVSDAIAYLHNNNVEIVYPYATATAFTFTPITPTPETALGVNNFWADEGDSDVTYRSSGTVTPVQPTLITKSITENGTYDAEDDDADGYSSVTVNVQGGATPFVPQFSETLIADNSSHASSFTLSEDYGNYDMVKIVWWESATVSGFLYTTPDILDEIFSVGVGKLCINKPSTNYYVCYTKNGLTWTQTNQRNIYVHEIYGVTFTNCTMTATDLYKRGASTTTKYAITSQTSLKDYDLFMMASIHATDGSETMPTNWLYQYPPENMSGAFSCPVPTVLQEYNANDEAFVISEYGMTAARYFMVQGITFTPSTPNLLSMGGLTSSNEEPEEPENNEEEEE